jgi:hypothetical protein
MIAEETAVVAVPEAATATGRRKRPSLHLQLRRQPTLNL